MISEANAEAANPRRYRVHLHSAPGMWAVYDGHVDVFAESPEDAFPNAVRELGRTSFPDRPSLSRWRLDRVEAL